MWIKEIVIDGFKSFSRRVVISDLDPKFNAITGLNGSGKSNIIDAICFALGLSSLALVLILTSIRSRLEPQSSRNLYI